ncbi:MAG: hypothetical protein H0T46_36755 [Deltaproteobacteria bacterium]|nr:hypothetical protein [Deltaproteobacteria bacterium]
MKRAFAMFGLLGVVGCFLPLAPGVSLFDLRVLDGVGVYLMIAAFAIPMVLGLAGKLSSGAKVAALGCFAYMLFYKMGFDVLDLLFHASIGGKAMAVAALGGIVTTLGSFAEAE